MTKGDKANPYPQRTTAHRYQRWLYPVDKKRANEYGLAYEEDSEAIEAGSAGSTGSAGADEAMKNVRRWS